MQNVQWIDVPAAGGNFQAYLSLPPTGKGPAILLLQEIFGVNRHIRAVADQYAQDGYVVLAPDLFWRESPRVELGYEGDDMARGVALMKQIDVQTAIADLSAAAGVLRKRPEVTGGKVAGIGYCFGGKLTYLLAAAGAIDVGIPYYGGGIQDELDKAGAIHIPMQFHYGEQDGGIPPAAVDKVKQSFLNQSDTEVHLYQNAGHGFNCWARAAYHQPSAALAHGRSLIFLSRHLG